MIVKKFALAFVYYSTLLSLTVDAVEQDVELYCTGTLKSKIVGNLAFPDEKKSWNISFNESLKRLYLEEALGKICYGSLLSEKVDFTETFISYMCTSKDNYHGQASDEDASIIIDRGSGVLNYFKRNIAQNGTLQFSAEMNCVKKDKRF